MARHRWNDVASKRLEPEQIEANERWAERRALGINLRALLRRIAKPRVELTTPVPRRRREIRLSDSTWQRLQALAASLVDAGVRTSAPQVAGALIELALDRMTSRPRAARRLPAGKKRKLRARAE